MEPATAIKDAGMAAASAGPDPFVLGLTVFVLAVFVG